MMSVLYLLKKKSQKKRSSCRWKVLLLDKKLMNLLFCKRVSKELREEENASNHQILRPKKKNQKPQIKKRNRKNLKNQKKMSKNLKNQKNLKKQIEDMDQENQRFHFKHHKKPHNKRINKSSNKMKNSLPHLRTL